MIIINEKGPGVQVFRKSEKGVEVMRHFEVDMLMVWLIWSTNIDPESLILASGYGPVMMIRLHIRIWKEMFY
jgi:hypothetical protein